MTREYIHLHFLVLIWGFTAILGLLITLPPVELVFYRTLLSFLALGLMIMASKWSFEVGKEGATKMLLTGVLISLHWILFFWSARVSNASVCLAGMATTSFWTSLVEPAFMKRKIRGFEVFLAMFVIVGIYVIFKAEFDLALGLILAILSAFIAAVFTVINAQLTQKHNPFVITFYEMIGACAGTALFFPLYLNTLSDGPLKLSPTGMDWIYIAILALVCTVYAYSASIKLMQKLTAFAVNLTVNLEPVYGIILAFIIFGDSERMNPGFYVGTALVLLSVLTYPVVNRMYKRKDLEIDNLR